MEHVQQFWSSYGLEFPFASLEHKHGKVFQRAAYVNKADYALSFADEPRIYRVRGMQQVSRTDGNRERRHHPTFTLLDSILDGSDTFPSDLTYQRGGLLKVGLYRIAQASANGYAHLKDLRPGDNLPLTNYQARYNNTHMRCPDEATFRRRRDRKRYIHAVPVEWFEAFGAEGIACVFCRMLQDKLRI
jgi:hypothetical protein